LIFNFFTEHLGDVFIDEIGEVILLSGPAILKHLGLIYSNGF
jgi:hypothetical protein